MSLQVGFSVTKNSLGKLRLQLHKMENHSFWKCYEVLDITGRFFSINDPKNFDFQLSRTLGKVKLAQTIFQELLPQKKDLLNYVKLRYHIRNLTERPRSVPRPIHTTRLEWTRPVSTPDLMDRANIVYSFYFACGCNPTNYSAISLSVLAC